MHSLSGNPEELYPCDYSLRIIGVDSENFVSELLQIIRNHIPSEDISPNHSTNNSKGGKYISLRVSFFASDRKQVERLSKALREDERVVTIL